MRALLLTAGVLALAACRNTPHQPPPPELPHVIGPVGRWMENCSIVSTPAGSDRQVSGCITEYLFVPGSVVVTVGTDGMGTLDSLNVFACQTATVCPAMETVRPSSGVGPNYSVFVPLPSPAGITRICAAIQYFHPTTAPPGTPPTQPYKSLPLGCKPVTPTLTAAVGAFKITPTVNGLELEGWFIDPTTDSPVEITVGRGLTPAMTATALAAATDARSRQPWPGFSDRHGLTVTLPFAGAPSATQICVWRGPVATPGAALGCFGFVEQTAAYASASIVRGNPLRVSLRNVPSGAAVEVNLRAAGGHFWLPWKHPAIWRATADSAGAADIDVPTGNLPPGQYTIAYHCAPECPGGNLDASQLIGGQPWSGTIKFGPLVDITPAVTRGLAATGPVANKVRVTGSGFGAGEKVGIYVVPSLANLDGFPHEATPVAYTVADSQGAFTIDVDVTGLPLTGANTQVIAFDSSHQPVAAIMFVAP
jgi:hypothetical protein